MKSKEKLESFVKYCEENPGERFWQALKNWSKAGMIGWSTSCSFHPGAEVEDTYEWE